MSQCQSQPGAELAATTEIMAFARSGDDGADRGRPHATEAHEMVSLGVYFGGLEWQHDAQLLTADHGCG